MELDAAIQEHGETKDSVYYQGHTIPKQLCLEKVVHTEDFTSLSF